MAPGNLLSSSLHLVVHRGNGVAFVRLTWTRASSFCGQAGCCCGGGESQGVSRQGDARPPRRTHLGEAVACHACAARGGGELTGEVIVVVRTLLAKIAFSYWYKGGVADAPPPHVLLILSLPNGWEARRVVPSLSPPPLLLLVASSFRKSNRYYNSHSRSTVDGTPRGHHRSSLYSDAGHPRA